jgi:hypothetical protein
MWIYTGIFVKGILDRAILIFNIGKKKIREVQVKKYEIENIERDKKIGPLRSHNK